MIVHGFALFLLLCLLPAAPVAAAETDGWSGAPAAWVAGIENTAFCGPGEWFFNTEGERTTATGTETVGAAELFFEDIYGRRQNWAPDVYVDELTALRIAREDDGRVTIQPLAGKTVAASRSYEPTTVSRVLRKVTASTQCQPDAALTIGLWDDVDDLGITHVMEATLALAPDGSLIARLDRYTCWMCINKNRTHDYVRFPAWITPSR